MIRVALFEDIYLGFYPEELRSQMDSVTEIEMRTQVFPDYVDELEEIYSDRVSSFEGDPQALIDSLEEGECLRVGDRLYFAESRMVAGFPSQRPDLQITDIPSEIFETMLEGEIIREADSERSFMRSSEDDLILVIDTVISIIRLIEVDTSRPWTIVEYEGAEYIEYIDYELVDSELSYYSKYLITDRKE